MARTIYGNPTGRAASTYLREFREYLYEEQEKALTRAKEAFGDALYLLKKIDPAGWEKWYDDTLPEWRGTAEEYNKITKMLWDRIKELLENEETASRYIISGGEVLELHEGKPSPLTKGGDMPF